MYFIGVDPGTHDTAIVVVDGHSNLLKKTLVLKTPKEIKGPEAVLYQINLFKNSLFLGRDRYWFVPQCAAFCYVLTVENQEISYTAKQGGNPRSMLPVAQVAGAMVGMLSFATNKTYFPMPQEWKGSTPKHINQKRTFDKLGIPCMTTSGKNPYCHPVDLAPWGLNKGDWEHAADAAGLALWGKEQYDKQTALAAFNEKRAQ